MRKRRGRASDPPPWATLPEEELLQRRLRNLDLRIEDGLEARVERLYAELASRGIQFRPHVWLSTSFFSPDGVPGFAIPFYLAHPRLMRLELACMHRVEGRSAEEFMQLARHETGHALISAYRLHKRPGWRALFGNYSRPYRASYRPDPKSKRFVRNLDGWYAQSHPAEDFCETFAVWLQPRSSWRRRYGGWPALEKLEFVELEMRRIRADRALVRSRERVEPISELRMTLREHYRRKRARYHGGSDPVDAGLLSVFAPRRRSSARTRRPQAGTFLRRHHDRLLRGAVRLSERDPYDLQQLLKRMTERAYELDLVVPESPGRLRAARALLLHETLSFVRVRRLEYVR